MWSFVPNQVPSSGPQAPYSAALASLARIRSALQGLGGGMAGQGLDLERSSCLLMRTLPFVDLLSSCSARGPRQARPQSPFQGGQHRHAVEGNLRSSPPVTHAKSARFNTAGSGGHSPVAGSRAPSCRFDISRKRSAPRPNSLRWKTMILPPSMPSRSFRPSTKAASAWLAAPRGRRTRQNMVVHRCGPTAAGSDGGTSRRGKIEFGTGGACLDWRWPGATVFGTSPVRGRRRPLGLMATGSTRSRGMGFGPRGAVVPRRISRNGRDLPEKRSDTSSTQENCTCIGQKGQLIGPPTHGSWPP